MKLPRLSRLEMRVMDVLWSRGPSSVRDVLDTFPVRNRPGYTTIQTIIYRLEAKKAIRRLGKLGSAIMFEPIIPREAAQRRVIDELLTMFRGHTDALMMHLIKSGTLTPEAFKEAQKAFEKLSNEEKQR